MYSPKSIRDRYVTGTLETASAMQIVCMAYDRLDRDLAQAIEAIETRDIERSHTTLIHAQELVEQLNIMLDLNAWDQSQSLAAIYTYVGELLAKANMKKSVPPVREARHLLSELGAAFAGAAASVQRASVLTTPEPAGPGQPFPERRLSVQA